MSKSVTDVIAKPKKHMKRRVLLFGVCSVAAIALIAVVSVFTGGNVNPSPSSTVYTGVKVRNFTLSSVRGGTVHEPWLDHRPAVVFFFASWCPPCQGEIPKIAKYLDDHHLGDGRVSYFGMDGDTYKSSALKFVDKTHVSFPVAFNPSDSVIQGDFRITFFPDTVFVSAKGVIQQVHFGAITSKELSQGVEQLLSASENTKT